MYSERLLNLIFSATAKSFSLRMIADFINGQQKKQITAGIIVIGDEILKGSTRDSNSNYLCKHLHEKGVLVKKISVIGDNVPEIGGEVRKFSQKFDIVFTTGGVGSTHDDRTFEGLANAFDDQLTLSSELRRVAEIFLLKTKLKNVNEAVDKFCLLPKSAKLLWGNQAPPSEPKELTNFPSVQIRNVIALPGVPQFCEQSFNQLKDYLFPSSMTSSFTKNIYLNKSEIHLQQKLTRIAETHKDVSIGSYPIMENNYFKTRINVESNSLKAGKLAFEELAKEFSDWIVNYDPDPWEDCVNKLNSYCKSQPNEFRAKIMSAIGTIDKILDEYSLEQIAISFNGGKDSTLLLHLFHICLAKKCSKDVRITGFFIQGDEFPEMLTFVRQISSCYNLNLLEFRDKMKKGLVTLKELHPEITVVLMGTRSTDPKGKFLKSNFEWTDENWPRFLRVCPFLDWSYSEIWSCIRDLSIPYCRLYDLGYSSLGERSNTAKNPALKVVGSSDRYLPAYALKDENLERAFREERPENGK